MAEIGAFYFSHKQKFTWFRYLLLSSYESRVELAETGEEVSENINGEEMDILVQSKDVS